jgi:hypothetical protein
VIAFVSSRCAEALSICPSVTLKSPSIRSGLLSLLEWCSASTFSQKAECSFLSLSVYMFIRTISSSLYHLNFIASACPSISSVMVNSFGVTRHLFITNTTPADAHEFSGRLEFIIVSLFLKHSLTECNRLSSRCVSCRARIAILFYFIVWYITDHFSIPFMFLAAAA